MVIHLVTMVRSPGGNATTASMFTWELYQLGVHVLVGILSLVVRCSILNGAVYLGLAFSKLALKYR